MYEDTDAIVRLSRGKMVEAWNNFDFMAMFRQLGALHMNTTQ